MAATPDEDWRDFYTEAGFRHGFAFGAQAVRAAVAPHLSPEQLAKLDDWLAGPVKAWKGEYLREKEPPAAPTL